MEGLKQKTIRAGTARLAGQFCRSIVRFASIVILARLLEPSDFGVVAMVMVLTGVFEIFATGGLSLATVQRHKISDAQLSYMFWFNLAIGVLLAALCVALAPALGAFYHEPDAEWVLIATAPAFVFTGAGVQHIAILVREMRHAMLSLIEVIGETIALIVGVAMALTGWGYWSLVGMALVMPLTITIGAWIATGWVPGAARQCSGVVSMLKFGGVLTLNNLIIYAGYNFEKLLLGRYFGADVLGLYSRVYELINLPTRIINSAFGSVTFAALSRVQKEPARFRSYFVKSYSLVLSITIPVTIFCAVLADDVILVVLGPKWVDGIIIFQLLAPTILVFGIINPFAWLLQSAGLHMRSLHTALVIAPLTICSYFIGIPYGPTGVAAAYSTAMVLWALPHTYWCLYGTQVRIRDLIPAIIRPFAAGACAGIAAELAHHFAATIPFPLVRLMVAGLAMLSVYAFVLLVVLKQWGFYFELLMGLKRTA